MKPILYSAALSALFFAACNNNTAKKDTATSVDSTTAPKQGKQEVAVVPASPIDGILNGYLELKNALTKDNDVAAAAAGNKMVKAFADFDKKSLNPAQSKAYADIEADAKEHAEHIGANTGNIKHQREHFETLSEDITELIKTMGTKQKLYVDHCPMYNNNKGANWLSETKDIQNPYLGQSMPTCGTVKEALN